MTTEYVSSVGGFTAANFYAGALNTLVGVAGVDGFHIAALWLPTEELSGVETLLSNFDAGGVVGYALQVQPSTVVVLPPNAIDVFATFGATVATATVINTTPGVPMLVHARCFADGADMVVELYINGVLAATATEVATVYAPPVDSPIVGALGPVAAPGGGLVDGRVIGVMYHEGALPAGVTPATFYTACREAKDMVWGVDTGGTPTSDFDSRYSVRENIAGSAVAPASWVPSTGAVNLARTGALTVRAHKNLDWDAALFAVVVPA